MWRFNITTFLLNYFIIFIFHYLAGCELHCVHCVWDEQNRVDAHGPDNDGVGVAAGGLSQLYEGHLYGFQLPA